MPVDIQVDYVTALKGCEQYALDLALLHSQEEVQVASTAISYQGMLVKLRVIILFYEVCLSKMYIFKCSFNVFKSLILFSDFLHS